MSEYHKKYYQKNKDKIKGYQKEYRQKNKDKIKEYQKEYNKEYYQNNKDKIKEYQTEYYQNNKDKIKEYQKNFYKFKRMLGELIFRLGNLGEYALYSMSEGKIEDKNFTNDFSLYIEVVSDPYKQIQMETIFNLLFKDSDTLRFDYLDLEIKLLVMNDLYNSSLDFDDIIDDVMISHEVDSDIELAKKFDVSVDTIKFVKNVYEAMPEKIIKMEKNIFVC